MEHIEQQKLKIHSFRLAFDFIAVSAPRWHTLKLSRNCHETVTRPSLHFRKTRARQPPAGGRSPTQDRHHRKPVQYCAISILKCPEPNYSQHITAQSIGWDTTQTLMMVMPSCSLSRHPAKQDYKKLKERHLKWRKQGVVALLSGHFRLLSVPVLPDS